MRIGEFGFSDLQRLPVSAGSVSTFLARIDTDAWLSTVGVLRQNGVRLIALWGAEQATAHSSIVSAAFGLEDGVLWLQLPMQNADGYPDLSHLYPCATRMQRAIYDLLGIEARGAEDQRPWLNHGKWPGDYFPLQQQCSGTERFDLSEADYPFVSVAGDGVHEIAVGPIHAGVIEPGHFRFSVVGEKVLRLEERLGYAHRGIERLFQNMPVKNGHRLAGRIAGDTTVAFSWAFCMAVEQALMSPVAPRALWLRALLLERERVANHLGDLGALGNDAGFGYGLAQFSRLKEDWLRLNQQIVGHRYLMDQIIPGGIAQDLAPGDLAAIITQCDRIEAKVHILQSMYDNHSGLQDRFATTGTLLAAVAQHFGVCGLVGRASGQKFDLRVDHPHAPYDQVPVQMAADSGGDVAARVTLRFHEIYESLRLIRAFCSTLPEGDIFTPVGKMESPCCGIGWVEGWRGDVLVALETDAGGNISRCHCHDPSWQNWPALEYAIIGNIVPDFPLINKSFSLNYAGHDL